MVKSPQEERRYELLGIAFVVIGIVSICGIFGLNAGFVGTYVARCLQYMFGIGALIASGIIVLIGLQYIVKHHGIIYSGRFFGLAALFASLLAFYHHFMVPPGEEIIPASLPDAGGLLGGGLLLLLRKFFGVDGGIVVLGGGIVSAILLSTTWSLATGLLKTKEKAVRSASAAGTVLSATYGKVAEVGDRMEERVVETVKEQVRQVKQRRMAYNQDADEHFRDEVSLPDPVAAGASLPEPYEPMREPDVPMREPYEPVPPSAPRSFSIEYSNRNGGEQADSVDVSTPAFGEEAESVPDTAPAAASEPVPEPAPEPASAPASAPKPYELPQISHILSKRAKKKNTALEMEIQENARTLAQTLEDFHVKANIINACHGPAVTRYELEPAPGVKVSKITNLSDDLALSLAAFSVRIEPIPGKSAIGIEVPNKELEGVQLREVLENDAFAAAKSKLTVGLGMDIGGQAIFADLAKMPHLLVAGATGSGKSVCVNTLITSILFKAKPDEVKFILIDPKMVELSNYNGIPHLMVPVVTDAKKAASVLNWAVQEMEKRYAKFADNTVRNMETYNNKFPDDKMFSIVIIIDELADLMMVAPHDVEDAICRLAQKARAAGIHLVLATQRPSVDVITGIIKANIPSRISFAVSSQIDSRTILDSSGAEKLLGKGDMLFYPVGASKPLRVQGAFVSDEEVEMLLDFIRSQGQEVEANEDIIHFTENAMAEEEKGKKGKEEKEEKDAPKVDELLEEAVNLVMTTGQASASNVQRRFRVGYTRAARLIDTMEQLGIVGPSMGSKPREIIMTTEEAMTVVHHAQAV